MSQLSQIENVAPQYLATSGVDVDHTLNEIGLFSMSPLW